MTNQNAKQIQSEEKPLRQYTFISSMGYWGKGETPIEAATNANVRGTWVRGSLYFADQNIVKGEIECTGMGGTEWTWADDFFKYIEDRSSSRVFRRAAKGALTKGVGEFKIIKGELHFRTVIDA